MAATLLDIVKALRLSPEGLGAERVLISSMRCI
jgi:hypothetical protein